MPRTAPILLTAALALCTGPAMAQEADGTLFLEGPAAAIGRPVVQPIVLADKKPGLGSKAKKYAKTIMSIYHTRNQLQWIKDEY
ncbi:MAG: hypothetical protein ACYTGX_14985, partial [Planctomycetota bacterium]